MEIMLIILIRIQRIFAMNANRYYPSLIIMNRTYLYVNHQRILIIIHLLRPFQILMYAMIYNKNDLLLLFLIHLQLKFYLVRARRMLLELNYLYKIPLFQIFRLILKLIKIYVNLIHLEHPINN